MAERVGFEPTVGITYTRFPSVRLKPLGHLSRDVRNRSNLAETLVPRTLPSLRTFFFLC